MVLSEINSNENNKNEGEWGRNILIQELLTHARIFELLVLEKPIVEIRWSDDCLISIIRFSVLLERQYLYTVKPVCNDHLYNKIYYLWFIQ